MATIRVYLNNKRMATGKEWKDKFLQVYPQMKEFTSQQEWRETWQKALTDSIRFVYEEDKMLKEIAWTREHLEQLLATYGKKKASAPAPAPAPPSTEGWTHTSTLSFTGPAGKYYIGDLCYALYENIYDKVFGGIGGYDGGLYTKGNSFFMVDGTAHGDGLYTGTDGFGYGVDAGIIGICSADLIDPDNRSAESGGNIYTFTEPVEMKFHGGVFRFHSGTQSFKIDTVGDESDY
jgi:hypothetical protein